MLVVLVRVIGRDHGALNADDALLQLRVDDVFSSQTPLLGSYQRFGWNQAGPLYFYILAIPYNLLGQTFSALQVGVVLINVVVAVAAVRVIALRLGWASGMWAAGVLAVVVRSVGANGLSDPWEPRMSVLLIVALVVLAWDATTGHRRSLYGTVVVGTLLAQAYATALFIAVAMVGIAISVMIYREFRASGVRESVRSMRGPFALAGALWAPVVIEQAVHRPGNLRLMVRFARDSGYDHLGANAGLKSLLLTGAVDAPWITNTIPKVPFTTSVDVDAASWFAPAWIAFAIALYVLARRSRTDGVDTRNSALLLTGMVGAAAVIMGCSIAGLIPPLFTWIFEPMRAIGALIWIPIGVAIAVWSPRGAKIVGAVSAAVVLVVGALAIDLAATGRVTPDRGAASLQRGANVIVDTRSLRGETFLVTSDIRGQLFVEVGYGIDEVNAALMLLGADVVVPVDRANRYGAARAHPERATYELKLIGEDASLPGGFVEIARVDPLGSLRARRAELAAVIQRECGSPSGLAGLRQCNDSNKVAATAMRDLRDIEDLPIVRFVGAPIGGVRQPVR